MRKVFLITPLLLFGNVWAQVQDTIMIDDVTVSAQRTSLHSAFSVESKEVIGASDLIRAACCNLGESFTANPSVDVSYSDAATGARQIKLLGLSGTYVQMLQENVPAFRSAALPFGLGYVPGPWMQSIQVSKGAASVRNGYESVTGQINIEYKKPQGLEGYYLNAYYDTYQKLDVNADAEVHLNDNLSTGLLAHFEQSTRDHDGNGDGFMDMPKVKQYNLMDRWCWKSRHWISQLSVRGLHEERLSGVSSHSHSDIDLSGHAHGGPYKIDLTTNRVEGQWKNALLMRTDKNESLALILKGVYHEGDNLYGAGGYLVKQKNAYGQLLYEADLTPEHNLSVGASFNHDYLDEYFQAGSAHSVTEAWSDRLIRLQKTKETTVGGYAQYTYKPNESLTAMAGVRYDYSSVYGGFVTPRLHLKYHPTEWVTLRLAAGKGYRSPHPIADNFTLLATGRHLNIEGEKLVMAQKPTRINQVINGVSTISKSNYYIQKLDKAFKQEEAWNAGGSLVFNIPLGDEMLLLNADYFYTKFQNQVVVDRDVPTQIYFYNLPEGGKSYSKVFQVDTTYPLLRGLTVTAAYRYQDVKVSEWVGKTDSEKTKHKAHELRTPVLTSRYKALVTASYKTPLELWQLDVTYQLNGPGRLPDNFNGEWDTHFKAFGQLSAQVTREFRNFSVYIGGENLTGFKQKNPIIGASNPYGETFDATMVWGPTEGAMGYVGFRLNIQK
ncbi:MAG: TonB-dependent receptor [Bacteroidales bacterium]|nr:TonB-dependent receptor [Bacteroidales bacterium]